MADDWRLALAFRTEAEARDFAHRLRDVELQGRGEFEERVIVSQAGTHVFLYTDSEDRIGHGREVADELLRERGLGAIITLTRWHPIEQRWEDASLPLPRTEEERARERQIRLERETAESVETGHAEWEVRIEFPTHHETVLLAEQLEAEGIPVVRRFTYLLVGAANEDEARALSERLQTMVPEDAMVQVEPGGQMVWEVSPTNLFVVFSELSSKLRRVFRRS